MAVPIKKIQERSPLAIMKEERQRDAARAWREYQAHELAVRANIERLRALRLAKASDNQGSQAKMPGRKPGKSAVWKTSEMK